MFHSRRPRFVLVLAVCGGFPFFVLLFSWVLSSLQAPQAVRVRAPGLADEFLPRPVFTAGRTLKARHLGIHVAFDAPTS